MLIQVIAPSARLMIRLNQFQLQGSELGPRLRHPAVIPGLGNICRVGNDNFRNRQSKKVRILPAYLLNIIHQNPNLRNEMIAKNS